MSRLAGWLGPDTALAGSVTKQSEACLAVYAEDRRRVDEDLATELTTSEGGYGRKQFFELVQNGADALLKEPGRIHVVLTDDVLYVANGGSAFSEAGVHAVMAARLDVKRGDEIGRFGLGFKSVVAVSDSPEVFSRSVSFKFDRAYSAELIGQVVPGREHYPVLRLARPVDPAPAAENDPVLRDLMVWASTVIRLPLKKDEGLRLRLVEDLAQFPAEFLLFCPHVHELVLEDRRDDSVRRVAVGETENGRLRLDDEGNTTDWLVLRRTHTPSERAQKDAGEVARRESLTIQWAVPFQGRNRLGSFWAFFPTQSQTTLSGIVNAPWKLSDDRQTLLEGEFNRELLEDVLPKMLADSLAQLLDSNDPVGILDLLPARNRGEIRSWGDGVLNEPVFAALARVPSIADCTGVLRRPSEVGLHPRDLPSEILEIWQRSTPEPTLWVNHLVDRTAERRSKVERLLPESASRSLKQWVECISGPSTIASSSAAIELVAEILTRRPDLATQARECKVLLLEDGLLAAPRSGTVFVRSSPEEQGFSFIDERLAALPNVMRSLDELGIKVLDRGGELRAALARPGAKQWDQIWALARSVPTDVSTQIFHESIPENLLHVVNVRNAESRWVPLDRALLGGPVVPLNGSRDRSALIDPRFHSADEDLLTRLGAVARPVTRPDAPVESWVRAYEDMVKEDFVKNAEGSKPAEDRLIIEGPRPPWPLELLSTLSDEARAEMTEITLQIESGGKWTVHHATNRSYGRKTYKAPTTWWLHRHGRLKTAVGPWPVSQCLAARDGIPEEVLPVAEVTDAVAQRLTLLEEPSQLNDTSWSSLLALALTWSDGGRRDVLYTWAVHFTGAPGQIRVGHGERARTIRPADVAVSCDPEEFQSLQEQRIPVVFALDPADKDALIQRWGLDDGSKMLKQELVVELSGAAEALVDQFPGLRLLLQPEQLSLELQPCSSIQILTATPGGQVTRSVDGMVRDAQILVTATEPARLLRQISNALHLDLGDHDIRRILDRQSREAARALLAEIRSAKSNTDRLLIAVGEEELQRAVPKPALDAVRLERNRELTGIELAEMAHAVHGLGVLQFFRSVLEQRGLEPPQQWAGRSAARRFVADLGFPTEYAGFSGDRRPPVLEVEGPITLPELHDYQRFVATRIKDLVRGIGPERGMVSLPTGAGKTRVAVEALIDEIRDGNLSGVIVWIAQSDELCEQAVQTWVDVWRAVGPGARLVISRFWDNNSVVEEPEATQLVVATPDKLRGAIEDPDSAWIAEASMVIVDEAHRSVAPQYTRVLDWLGRGRGRKDPKRLIGLTATPFRSTNKLETGRLIRRYDSNRLDHGAFETNPYAALQDRGILAQVRHELLQGIDVHLTDADQTTIRRMMHLPPAVEDRLGSNLERNLRIVDSVATLPTDWPVLLFATTVENARTIAAQLTLRGVPSVAISSQTEKGARRRYIEQFHLGEIRVITNYNVLSQGFDAPAVRAVYVTRPTFSTNLYQQMIGRGLRGPRNGGSDEVLIVNVRDNLNLFGEQLAFHHFEDLWDNPTGLADVDPYAGIDLEDPKFLKELDAHEDDESPFDE